MGKLKELELDAARQITIRILNASGTLVTIGNYYLDGGSWEKNPEAGSPINPGDNANYVNFTDRPFTNLGGALNLDPASGGKVDIHWEWAWGSSVNGSATGSSLAGVAVSSTIINGNTNKPILQVNLVNDLAFSAKK